MTATLVGGPLAEVLPEVLALESAGTRQVLLLRAPRVDLPVLAGALASGTTRVRLGIEVDTAAVHPYAIARKLAALDKISRGRIEWWPHDVDRGRQEESVAIVEALLRSWAPGATVNDRARGVHVDTGRITSVHHDGVHWSVHSPLDVPAGPQGVVPRVRPEGAAA